MDQIVNSSWIGTIVNNGLTDLENDLSRISVTLKEYSVSVLNMRSESENKEGHAVLLKLHRGAHMSRSSTTETRNKIVHSHRGQLCRRRPSRTTIDVPKPEIPETPKASETDEPPSELPASDITKDNSRRTLSSGYARDSQRNLLSKDPLKDIKLKGKLCKKKLCMTIYCCF